MFGLAIKTAGRHVSAGLAALVLTLPAQASTPDGALADASAAASAAPFEDSFEPFESLPSVPEPVGGAVDIDSFEPPLEPEPTPRDDMVARYLGTGVASYYGRRFHGRRTANGERFDMNDLTAAHKTLPFGTRVRVTNDANGRSVVVRINDRGPFVRGRTIDLSREAAQQIGMISRGHAKVRLEVLQ